MPDRKIELLSGFHFLPSFLQQREQSAIGIVCEKKKLVLINIYCRGLETIREGGSRILQSVNLLRFSFTFDPIKKSLLAKFSKLGQNSESNRVVFAPGNLFQSGNYTGVVTAK